MRVLLDTHVVLWWLLGDRRLPARVRGLIADRESTRVWVSAASGWEIATKHRLGKLAVADQLVTDLALVLQEQAFEVLPISLVHAVRAGAAAAAHRDPFDRLIAAQAILEGAPVVSADGAFDSLGAARMWK